MNISLEEEISVEEYIDFRASVGWTAIKPERVKSLLDHSTFLVRAKADGKTVGMARSMFDFGYTAYFGDVIVKPEFQEKSIGRLMIEHLISKVKANISSDDYLVINLVAAPGKSGFYEKLGFSKRTGENGWGMCIKQNACSCC